MHIKNAFLALVGTTLLLTGCLLKNTEAEGEEESERDEMQKAMQQEFMMTVDPALGYVPKERLITALNYQKRLIAARGSGLNAITWQERGPNNIAGRTRALLVDLRDATGNTVFAGSVSGGIWKTTNFKTASQPNWTPVNESMGSLAVCALAQDPVNKNTFYAGTGEGWFNIDAIRGNGIWQSIDGGSTWNKLASTDSTGNQHDFDYVQDIVVNNQGIVFAACRSIFCNRGGVFRSANNGATWTRVIGTPTGACNTSFDLQGTDLEVAANGDVYACVGTQVTPASQNGRIFRSNAGANVGVAGSWTNITPAGTWQRIDIAVAPSNSSVVYALLQGTGDGIGAIKKSTNSGASWTDLPLPNWCNQGNLSNDFTNSQAFYDLIIQVDPTNENNVIIGGIDLFKSTNGGASWNQITQWARNCTTGSGVQLPTIHADQHNVVFIPGSSTDIIATNDGGIYYSGDGGNTWLTSSVTNVNGSNQTVISQKSIGYNTIQLYGCDVHPVLTNYFLVGSQDNGSLKLINAGLSTGQEASIGGDGGFAHIDQTNGNLQLVSYVYNNYYYSRNGGSSFSRINFNDNGMFINPSDLDDSRKVLFSGYVKGQLGVVSNLNNGTPSFSAFTIPELGSRKISALKTDPTVSGGGTVWIAGYDSSANVSQGTGLPPNVIKLTNANVSPTAAANFTFPVPVGSYISSIDVDPADANHILVTLSNFGITSVFESTNGGSSFSSIEGNLPDIPVRWGIFVPTSSIVDGSTPGGILLGTEIGVWSATTTAGSATVWTPQTNGLPRVRCDMIRYRTSDGLLAVATHGRGLFTASLGLVTGIPPATGTTFIKYISATRQELFIKIGDLNTSEMDIRVFAIDGKLVYSSKTSYADQHIPVFQFPQGTYVVKIYGNNKEQFTQKFIK